MGKHIIEIAPNNAIYIDSYRVVGDKPWGLFETRRITVSEYDLKEIVKRCNEIIKDEPKAEQTICDFCRYYNSNIPCGSTPSACKKADKFAEEFILALRKCKENE